MPQSTHVPPGVAQHNTSARGMPLCSEPPAKQGSQVEQGRMHFRRLLRFRRANRYSFHSVTDSAVDETRELIECVLGAAPRRIRVEWIRDTQIILRPRHCYVH